MVVHGQQSSADDSKEPVTFVVTNRASSLVNSRRTLSDAVVSIERMGGYLIEAEVGCEDFCLTPNTAVMVLHVGDFREFWKGGRMGEFTRAMVVHVVGKCVLQLGQKYEKATVVCEGPR